MKVFDIYFKNRMNRDNTIWNILASNRVAIEDTQELNLEEYVRLMASFIANEGLLESSFANELPEQVLESLKALSAGSSLNIFEIESALTVLRYFNYDIMVVHRTDLTEDRDIKDPDVTARSYTVERFRNNPLQISNYYTGTSIAYKDEPRPFGTYVFDAFSALNLNDSELSKFGLNKNVRNYNQLISIDVATWDYREVLEYMHARGFDVFVVM